MQAIRRAVSLALLNAGSNMAAKMAMMAITTSSSINVNALCALPEDEFPTNTFKKTFVDGRRLKLFTEKCPDHFRPCETTTLYLGLTSDGLTLGFPGCGRSSMVERQSSKLHTRVRFPSPAPLSKNSNEINGFIAFSFSLEAKMRIKTRMKGAIFFALSSQPHLVINRF